MRLETFFPYRLAIVAEAFSRNLVEVYGRAYGLSREEWRLLLLLAEAKRLTSLELSQRTTLDKVQISRAAQKLDDKGLVDRTISKKDRRLRIYQCTSKGHQLFDTVLPQVQARADKMLDGLKPDEREALEKGLAALTRSVRENGSPSADIP